MLGQYILVGQDPVHCLDPIQWGQWMETHDRVVRQEEYKGFWVSTIFLGLDHSFSDSPPVVFETMIFPSKKKLLELWCRRACTWGEALGHHMEAKREIDKGTVLK